MAVLSVEGLRCCYGNAVILRDVDIEVDAGEVVALLGRNGMGKTSLVRTVLGMRPPEQAAGRIDWRGDDISQLPSHSIARRGITIVPQGRHVFGSLSVRENLTVAARGQDGSAWTTDRVLDLFPRLGERIDNSARDLSGGEQQMLAIGRALMTNPSLVLMDEPSEGLAPIVVGQIRQQIESLKGGALTILLVEQNLGLAMRLADRVYVLGEGGRIVWHGTPAELDEDAATKKNHLGV